MNIKSALGVALRNARQLRGLTQEDFGLVSSRVYVSALELGKRGATVEKIFQLSKVLKINPVTLVAFAYLRVHRNVSAKELLSTIKSELESMS